MKIKCGWSKKHGRPEYSSDCASCDVELDIDDALAADPVKLREQIRRLHLVCYQTVEDELREHAPLPPTELDPPSDDPHADLRPGDRGYRADDRGSYGSDEDYDQQIQEQHDNRPPPRRNNGPPPRQNNSPPQRQNDGRQGGGGGNGYPPPRNAKMFNGWFQGLKDKGDWSTRKLCERIGDECGYGTTTKNWSDDECVYVYGEAMRRLADRSRKNDNVNAGGWGGNGNGRNGDGRGR
jgi:hypothetical protein